MAKYAALPDPADLLKKVQAPQVQQPAVASGPPGPAAAAPTGFTAAPRPVTPAPAPAPAQPSGAAQRYFNSFGQGYQKKVTDSFVPGKGDNLQTWFDNAVAAGAVNPDGSRKVPESATTGGRRPAERMMAAAGGGGGAPASPGGSALSGTLEEAIKAMMAGEGGAYDPATISNYKAAAKSAAEGGRRTAVSALDEDLISRGIGRSGVAARGALDASNAAGGQYTQAVADIMNQAAGERSQLKQAGLGFGINKAQMDQDAALRREEMALQERLAKRGGGGGGGPQTFQYMDPETGDTYELPIEMLG